MGSIAARAPPGAMCLSSALECIDTFETKLNVPVEGVFELDCIQYVTSIVSFFRVHTCPTFLLLKV